MFRGFRDFVLRGNMIDLAVGVVIGAAFGTVASSLVKDLLTPLIAVIVRQPNIANLFFEVNGVRFLYGDLLTAVFTFLLIAATVYCFVVVPVNRMMAHFQKAAPMGTKKCPECLSEIHFAAMRCAFCTSEVD